MNVKNDEKFFIVFAWGCFITFLLIVADFLTLKGYI
jgi:hypothetical protein